MHGEMAYEFLWIGGAILLSLLLGAAAKKIRQPAVLGGLIAGLVIGIVFTGTHFMEELRSEHGIPFISRMAELAAMLLLFKAGLEGNLNTIIQDAKTGWKVAIVGIVLPVVGGFGYVLWATDVAWEIALFQGGVFAATSVGITAAVLGELGVLSEKYAKIIISAAVIDDVLGLIVLTICIALNASGEVDAVAIGMKIGAALLFVVVVPVLGHFLAPKILKGLNRLDVNSRESLVIGFMILYGVAAMFAGLAGIVGAYFAGVALEEHYFVKKGNHEGDHAVEHFIDGLITAFGPVFFVYAGCVVDPTVFLNPSVLLMGVAFTAIAMIGKLACGIFAPSGSRWIVGVGMSPRGEVGIIFATIGLTSGILTKDLYGASMIMVLLTTIATPPVLGKLIAKAKRHPA